MTPKSFELTPTMFKNEHSPRPKFALDSRKNTCTNLIHTQWVITNLANICFRNVIQYCQYIYIQTAKTISSINELTEWKVFSRNSCRKQKYFSYFFALEYNED